ncbi:MAG: SphA family protein, partial [Phenylobacterium sp.]
TGGPGVALMPPIQGVFFANSAYYYDGKGGGGKNFLLGGNLVAGLKAKVVADFPTALWVPTTNLGGGTLALGLILPFGEPDVDVSAILTGPRGNSFNVSRSDSQTVWGDPVMMAMFGWKTGDLHIQASTLINAPIGQYRHDKLANLAFHRWAADTSLAATWRNETSGWDVSGKAGFTFNGENHYTDYDSGTEFHLEGSVERIFSPAFSLGVQGYYYNQVSGDSGSGARLGSFEGEVSGVGATGAYNFKIADKIPASLRLRAFHEFEATNRLEGDSVFLDFTMPLYVKLPPGAGGH